MKKHIPFLILLWVLALNAKATNINKPVAAQYGFIQNKGQIIDQNNQANPHVLYLYNGNGLRVQLRKGGFSYEVIHTVKTPKTIINEEPTGKFASAVDSFDISHEVHRVDINFKGGNKNAVLKPYEPASDYINYYTTGTGEEGITQVQHFQKVIYENVYPNIDIEFVLNDATNKGKFKYNFIVKPNANLADIQLELIGANRTSLNKAGNILIETAYGNIEENIPLSYVINENKSHSIIKANFITLADNIFGIKAEDYNHNQTLVIDPTNWATYYGGSSADYGNGITTDTSGNTLVTGQIYSSNAIATTGSFQTILGGISDAFIAKFNSSGIIQWATYYGGSSDDCGNGIATDGNGNIIISGRTSSSIAIATVGAHQTVIGGSIDAFIVKFNSNGIRQWATYYGGSNNDNGIGVATDAGGNIIIIGQTSSSNAIATTGSYQTIYGGGSYDAFIAKFNSIGIIQWATYYGGSNDDRGIGIVADTNGNIIITGFTTSSNAIAIFGAHQPTFGGSPNPDGFIAKFNTNGIMQWATYYGGSNYDKVNGIAIDANGNIIIIGETRSSNDIATIGAHQTVFSGGSSSFNGDAFIAKFNTNGVRQWATYFGETGPDYGNGIAIDANGNIMIIGRTGSTNAIATLGSYQTIYGGNHDAFVAKLDSNGIIQWATYFGGSDTDFGVGITTDVNGNILVTGYTYSSNGIATVGAHQTIYGGAIDAFIAKFSATGILPVKLIAFNAVLDNKKVNCTWETASEINNNYFAIEKSTDGNHFESIGRVKGKGNTNTNTRYSFIDNNPFTGISYYRLKQTDFDNTYSYSAIKRVGSSERLNSTISLYYENNNPTVKINAEVASNAIIELISLAGIPLFTQEQATAVGENTIPINSNGTSGFYLLKVQLEDQIAYFKVWMR
jgi:hypothetical protein